MDWRAFVVMASLVAGLHSLPGRQAAAQSDAADRRSGFVVGTGNGTETLFQVPKDSTLVVTDLIWSTPSPVDTTVRITLELQSGTTARWEHGKQGNLVRNPSRNASIPPATGLIPSGTGIAFGSGKQVDFRVLGLQGAQNWAVAWSGYLTTSTPEGVEEELSPSDSSPPAIEIPYLLATPGQAEVQLYDSQRRLVRLAGPQAPETREGEGGETSPDSDESLPDLSSFLPPEGLRLQLVESDGKSDGKSESLAPEASSIPLPESDGDGDGGGGGGADEERVLPPTILAVSWPVYPPEARKKARVPILLAVHVTETGTVDSVQVENEHGCPACEKAVVASAWRLRCLPATRHGKPVATWMRFPITFGRR